MAMTLEQMKVGMNDKIAEKVIDTFIRESEILELMPFDNCVSPDGNGSTLTYGYIQEQLPSTTAFRALNTEYTPNEATRIKKSVDLAIFGGAFGMDRVLKSAEGKYNNLAYQMEQKIKSAVGTFHNAMINGDSSSNADEFDGLDKFLVGQSTEMGTDNFIDISTMEKVKANADVFYEALIDLITNVNADAIMVNRGLLNKISTVARILGYKTETEEAFGRRITNIDGVRIIDLKNIATVENSLAKETPIIGVKSRKIGSATTATAGLTDIYGVHFSVDDGFHGVTLDGTKGIKSYLPDFSTPGAVKKGEVEMVAATALKNIKSAGVLRNIKIV